MTRVALAGFGSSGQTIHAPLLHEAGCDVVAVSTSDAGAGRRGAGRVPGHRGRCPGLDDLLAVPGVDLVVLATPSGGHAAQVRAVVDAGIAVRRRQAARRRRADGGSRRAVRRGGRGAAHRLPEPALRPRAGDGRPRRGRRARRHAVPLRDALGAVAPGAQGPLAREREREPRAAASCSTCTATSSTRPCSCSARWRRCSPPSTRAPPRPRTTRSSSAGTPAGVVSHLGATSLSGAPGPAGAAARHRGGVRDGRLHRRGPRVERAGRRRRRRTAGGSTAVTSASRWRAARRRRPTSTARSSAALESRRPAGRDAGRPVGRGAHPRRHRRRARVGGRGAGRGGRHAPPR